MSRGIPLWQEGQWEFYASLKTDEPHSHVAYPADEARRREAVVEAARAVSHHFSRDPLELLRAFNALDDALADLDAGSGGAG